MESLLIELDRSLGLRATSVFFRLELVDAVALVDHHATEVIGRLDEAGANGFSGRSLLVLAESTRQSADVAGTAHPVAAGARFDRARECDFAGRRVDDAEIDRHVRILFVASEGEAVEIQATATARGV